MQVSVIIPTYERCDSLKRTLTALSHQTFPCQEYEVIVSVDGSTDSTMEMLKCFEAPYKLHTIWNTNAGRSAARNKGLEEAEGDVLIFLDDDMEPHPVFLERHYERHKEGQRICVMGNVPVNIDEQSPPLDIYLAKTVYIPFMARLSSPEYRFQGLEFYSGNFSIRRDVLREIGEFNTGYSVNEDSELGLRMANAGIEVLFESGARAKQYIEKDFSGMAAYTVEQGKSNVLFILEHPESFNFRRICEYNKGPKKWRLFRNGLIGTSRIIPQIPGLVARLVGLTEKITPDRMDRYYSLSLDFYFWLGVASALGELPDHNELKSKIKSHREPRRSDFISAM